MKNNGAMKVTGKWAFYSSFKFRASCMYLSNADDLAANRTFTADYCNQQVVPLDHAADNYWHFNILIYERTLR